MNDPLATGERQAALEPGDRVAIYVFPEGPPLGTVVECHDRLDKRRVQWDDGLNTWVWASALVPIESR